MSPLPSVARLPTGRDILRQMIDIMHMHYLFPTASSLHPALSCHRKAMVC